ncbi:MAG: hypothetical protein ACXVED_19200, partial [Bacteroidia bacterium]
ELVDFAFHVTSFIDFVLRMGWSGSLRSKFDFVAKPKGNGFSRERPAADWIDLLAGLAHIFPQIRISW